MSAAFGRRYREMHSEVEGRVFAPSRGSPLGEQESVDDTERLGLSSPTPLVVDRRRGRDGLKREAARTACPGGVPQTILGGSHAPFRQRVRRRHTGLHELHGGRPNRRHRR